MHRKKAAGGRTLIVALIAFLLLVAAYILPSPLRSWVQALDQLATTLRFDVRGPEEPDARLRVVGITENTIDAFESIGEFYPLPRYWHAYAIRRLADAGARVIVIDLLFAEKDSFDAAEDEALRDAIRYARSRNCEVVLAAGIEISSIHGSTARSLLLPSDIIMEAEPILGMSNSQVGYKDAELLSISLESAASGPASDTQAVAALRALYRLDDKDADSVLKRADPHGRGHFRINYCGPPDLFAGYVYDYTNLFQEALPVGEGELSADEWPDPAQFATAIPAEAERLRRIFLDTVVFIGSRAQSDKDTFLTPVGPMFGVDTNSQAFNTLLTDKPLLGVPPVQVLTLCALLALLAWAISLIRPLLRSILLALMVAAALITADVYLFVYLQRDLSPTMALSGFLLPFISCVMYAGLLEEAERRRTRSIFSSFLPKEIVDQIIDNPHFAEQGVRINVALMFNDIRNYSTISESLTAQQIVSFLRVYFNEVSEVINKHRGGVGKFMGDGMMAWFGGPTPTDDPAGDAVRAGIELIHVLRERVHPKLRELEVPEFQVGIGIHMGSVVMGEVGNARRRDYTVIGDSVNVASRVEGLTKELGWALLVTREVLAAAHSEFDAEFVGEHHVKGRLQAVEVYRIIDPKAPEIFRLDAGKALSAAALPPPVSDSD